VGLQAAAAVLATSSPMSSPAAAILELPVVNLHMHLIHEAENLHSKDHQNHWAERQYQLVELRD
jgi:hypothetical protein